MTEAKVLQIISSRLCFKSFIFRKVVNKVHSEIFNIDTQAKLKYLKLYTSIVIDESNLQVCST